MVSDDEKARKARAERLRKEIDQLTTPHEDTIASCEDGADENEITPRENESPRDFIHRRMHELDKGKKDHPSSVD